MRKFHNLELALQVRKICKNSILLSYFLKFTMRTPIAEFISDSSLLTYIRSLCKRVRLDYYKTVNP